MHLKQNMTWLGNATLLLIALPLASAQTACFLLDDSTLCGPDYAGYPVLRMDGLTNTSQFNSALQRLGGNPDEVAKFLATPQLACPAARTAVDSLRFQVSAFCAGAVSDALKSNCAPSQTAQKNVDPSVLCTQQCNVAQATLTKLFTNATVCPATTDATVTGKRTERMNSFASYCNEAKAKNQAKCITGTKLETDFCGWTSKAVAEAQCKLVQNDGCCQQLFGGGEENKSNLAGIVGGIIAVIVLAALAISFWVCRRRRAKNNAAVYDYSSNNKLHKNEFNQNSTGRYAEYDDYSRNAAHNMTPAKNDSWNMQQETKIDIQPPHTAYHAESISMAPISASSYPSQSQSPSTYQGMPSPQAYTQPESTFPIFTIADSTPQQPTYDAQLPSHQAQQSQSYPQSITSDEEILNIPMRVIHPYVPSLADELPLEPESEIIMVRSFDDGWALGVIPSTGQQGAFPLVCVTKVGAEADVDGVEQDQNQPSDSAPRDAVSSMFGTYERVSTLPQISNRVSSQRFSKIDLGKFATLERNLTKLDIPAPATDIVIPSTNESKPPTIHLPQLPSITEATPMPHTSFGAPEPRAPPRIMVPPSPDTKLEMSPVSPASPKNPFSGPFDDDKTIPESASPMIDQDKPLTIPDSTPMINTLAISTTHPSNEPKSPALSTAPSLPELRISALGTLDLDLGLAIGNEKEERESFNPFKGQ